MRILISGATGLIGRNLSLFLREKLETGEPLGRGMDSAADVAWDPESGRVVSGSLEGFDAVVHLAAESIANGRWTEEKKRLIVESRSLVTRRLSELLAGLATPPRILVSASAVGFYGSRGDEILDENSTPGSGFLAEVCREWEAATAPAGAAGIRVSHVRFGVVLDSSGGMLKKLRRPFSLGLGGVIGTGQQWMSWVTAADAAAAIYHVMRTPELSGAVNVTSPNAVTNAEFTATLARILRRPALFRLPAPIARAAFGEMANELLLASTRVLPEALLSTGFRFGFAELVPALKSLL